MKTSLSPLVTVGPASELPERSPQGVPAQETNTGVLTVKEAARRLRVSAKTLYAEIAAGKIFVVRIGRVIRVPLAAIEALLRGDVLGSRPAKQANRDRGGHRERET